MQHEQPRAACLGHTLSTGDDADSATSADGVTGATGADAARVDDRAATSTGPAAVGVRRPWEDIPASLRAEVGQLLGTGVVSAATQVGGFSPGVAARLRLADGGRAFVKAVAAETNPISPDIYRREVGIAARLPTHAPAPRLYGSIDRDGWVLLVFEDIEGRPPALPWRPDELDRVLSLFTELADVLTPTPVAVAPRADHQLAQELTYWAHLASAYAEGTDDLTDLDPWIRRNLDDLVAWERGIATAVAGETLLHCDLRADNLLLTSDAVIAVDWPWATTGTPWLDLVAFLPSMRMQGGPPPEVVVADHPLTKRADPDAVTAVLAGLTGTFLSMGRRPAPPGLPTVRAFQTAQGQTALKWLRRRLA